MYPLLRNTLLIFALTGSMSACSVSSHPTQAATLGKPVTSTQMEALIDQPGPIELQTFASADWEIDLSGLLNLSHPKAKAAGLKDKMEAIQVYAHVLKHPRFGTYLVDTGVSEQLINKPEETGIGWAVRQAMHLEKMKAVHPTAEIVAQLHAPLQGVFFTHLHFDHISGMPDIPAATALFSGPHETTDRHWMNIFTHGTTDALLTGKAPVQEWQFQPDADRRFAGVTDIFGDGSIFAIWSPGHTAGSVAYVVRTTQGPVLLTGDVCHTRWGWEHDVEPGSFTRDQTSNAASLHALKLLADRHPGMQVRLGHQP